MSKTIEVKVPAIGDFKNIPVIEVLVKPGDVVKVEDSLVTLESDKATLDVPAPQAGVVKEIKTKLGDKVSEGTLILTLETEIAPSTVSLPASTTTSATAPTPNASPLTPHASRFTPSPPARNQAQPVLIARKSLPTPAACSCRNSRLRRCHENP